MAELLTMDISCLSEEDAARWLAEMDEESRERVLRVTAPHRRLQTIAGDHLARVALGVKSGKAPVEIHIHRTENGKPYAEEGCFSISHSGDLVVCALSECAVGVDVEQIRAVPEKVAQRYFSEGERHLLQRSRGRKNVFWRIWTGKEALCKLSGEGLAGIGTCDSALPPEGVRLTTDFNDGYVITVAERKCDSAK